MLYCPLTGLGTNELRHLNPFMLDVTVMSPATGCGERGATSIDITAKPDFVVFGIDVVFQACQSAVFIYATLISAPAFLLFRVWTYMS